MITLADENRLRSMAFILRKKAFAFAMEHPKPKEGHRLYLACHMEIQGATETEHWEYFWHDPDTVYEYAKKTFPTFNGLVEWDLGRPHPRSCIVAIHQL